MNGTNVPLSELSPAVLIALGLLALVQIGMQVTALVQLAHTPQQRIALGGRKWLWIIIIVSGLLGAILWFGLGRTPAISDETRVSGVAEDRQSAVDTLYGPGKDGQ